MELEDEFAAIAAAAADLRARATAAGKALSPELNTAVVTVAYNLRQAEVVARAIAGQKSDPGRQPR